MEGVKRISIEELKKVLANPDVPESVKKETTDLIKSLEEKGLDFIDIPIKLGFDMQKSG